MSRWSRCVLVMVMVCVLWAPPSAHAACGDVDNGGDLNILDLILLVHAIVNETVDELQCAGNLDSDCPVGAIIGVDAAGKWACGSAGELGVVGAQGPEGPQGPGPDASELAAIASNTQGVSDNAGAISALQLEDGQLELEDQTQAERIADLEAANAAHLETIANLQAIIADAGLDDGQLVGDELGLNPVTEGTCAAENEGAVRWLNGGLQACDGAGWRAIATVNSGESVVTAVVGADAPPDCHDGNQGLLRVEGNQVLVCSMNGMGESATATWLHVALSADPVSLVDECAAEPGPCDSNADCADTYAGYSCVCKDNWVGDGITCVVDPCTSNPCDPNATCESASDASYVCTCGPGYLGTGFICAVDHCLDANCDANASCSNQADGYTCACDAGYAGDGMTCSVDYCYLSPCDANATCTNGIIAATCDCNAGYVGDGASCTALCDDAGLMAYFSLDQMIVPAPGYETAFGFPPFDPEDMWSTGWEPSAGNWTRPTINSSLEAIWSNGLAGAHSSNLSYDLQKSLDGANADNAAWVLDYDFKINSNNCNGASFRAVMVGLSSTPGPIYCHSSSWNPSCEEDAIWFGYHAGLTNNSANRIGVDTQDGGQSSQTSSTDANGTQMLGQGQTYYVRAVREGTTTAWVKVYSDPERTQEVTGALLGVGGQASVSASITDLRYIKIGVRQYFDENKGNDWTIDNIKFYNGISEINASVPNVSIAAASLGVSSDGVVHGATDATGVDGGALSFDGNTSFVQAGTSQSDWNFIHNGSAWSVAFWYKANDLSAPQVILNNNGSTNTNVGFQLMQTGGKLRCRVNNQGDVVSVTTSAVPDTTDWHHYVFSYDPSQGAGQLNAYRDGVFDTSASTSGTPSSGDAYGPMTIGTLSDNHTLWNLDGLLDEFMIWKRALSSDDVNCLYGDGGGGPTPTCCMHADGTCDVVYSDSECSLCASGYIKEAGSCVSTTFSEAVIWTHLDGATTSNGGEMAACNSSPWACWAASDKTWSAAMASETQPVELIIDEHACTSGAPGDPDYCDSGTIGWSFSPEHGSMASWASNDKDNWAYAIWSESSAHICGDCGQLRVIVHGAVHNYDSQYTGPYDTVTQRITMDADGTVRFYYAGQLLHTSDVPATGNYHAFGAHYSHASFSAQVVYPYIPCNGHGQLQADSSCVCEDGHVGLTCMYSHADTCSGLGLALSDGSCICDDASATTPNCAPLWNFGDATAAGAIDFSSYESQPRGFAMAANGSRFFTVGDQENKIQMWEMTTPFDVTTAERKDSWGGIPSYPRGIAFSPDGKRMYVVNNGATIHQYDLPVAWDLVTVNHVHSHGLSNSGGAVGLHFSPDGKKLYHSPRHEYALSEAWNIQSAVYQTSISFGDVDPTGVVVSDDGKTLWGVGYQYDTIREYKMSTAWDLSTASATGVTVDVSQSGGANPFGMSAPTGTSLFIAYDGGDQDFVLEWK